MTAARRLTALASLLALTACAGTAPLIAPVAGGDAPQEEVFATAPTVAPPSTVFGLTAASVPQVASTGPALDLNWRNRFSAGVAYVNVTDAPVPVFSGPDGLDQIGRLAPGNGGGIDACAVEVNACSIAFGSGRQRGWVMMDAMAPAGGAS